MFTLSKINNSIYLIVKKGTIDKPFDLPNKTPFQTYGFLLVDGCIITIITKSPEVEREGNKLLQLVMEDRK